ncbi:unnamed protein product, partial [Heterotrigona itama]
NMATSSPQDSVRPNENKEDTRNPQIGTSEGTSEICTMTLHKLPPFRKENPKFWVIQIESAMHVAKVTSDNTKFHYVISQLEPDILSFSRCRGIPTNLR